MPGLRYPPARESNTPELIPALRTGFTTRWLVTTSQQRTKDAPLHPERSPECQHYDTPERHQQTIHHYGVNAICCGKLGKRGVIQLAVVTDNNYLTGVFHHASFRFCQHDIGHAGAVFQRQRLVPINALSTFSVSRMERPLIATTQWYPFLTIPPSRIV